MTKRICDRCKKELTKTEVSDHLPADLCYSCIKAMIAAAPKPKPPPNAPWDISLRREEPKQFLHLGGGFCADLTATECNMWRRYVEPKAVWRERELSVELLRHAIAQQSVDAVTVTHKALLDYHWHVYELAEAWYAELVKTRAAADESDKGER